jgi:hypothetical protein
LVETGTRQDASGHPHRAKLHPPGRARFLTTVDRLETRCRELWAQTLHGSQPGAVVDVWAEEVGSLMQLSRPFDGFVEYVKRVPPTCLVHLDRNRYSVSAWFANRPVSLRVYERICGCVVDNAIMRERGAIVGRWTADVHAFPPRSSLLSRA